jgi:hypothetical protein
LLPRFIRKELRLCCTESLYFLSIAIPRARGCNFRWNVLRMSEDLKVLSREGRREGKECVMELLEFLRVVMN